MLGAIIGDIVGSRWEFNPTNDYNFKWLSEKNGFTDDTICTVAVAEALIKGRDFGVSIHEWCRKFPSPMGGYGGRFALWVNSNNPQPYGSFGNGSAMRVSPIAHWYKDEQEMLDAARATALPSHNHEEGIKGAQTVALAIFKAMQYNRHYYLEAVNHIDDIIRTCVEFSGYDINVPKKSVLNRFDETCQGTVPVALKIISIARCFEDAVRIAVSLGADADTLGAIVGSMAESIWGIPNRIRHQIEEFLPDDILDVVREFHLKRPESEKNLIDTIYSGNDFCDASWDVLYDTDGENVYNEIRRQTIHKNAKKRNLMIERTKARDTW